MAPPITEDRPASVSAGPAATPQPPPPSTTSDTQTASASPGVQNPFAPQPSIPLPNSTQQANPEESSPPTQSQDIDPYHSTHNAPSIQQTPDPSPTQDLNETGDEGYGEAAGTSQQPSHPTNSQQQGDIIEGKATRQDAGPSQSQDPTGEASSEDPEVSSTPKTPTPDPPMVTAKDQTLREDGAPKMLGSQTVKYSSGSVWVGNHYAAMPTQHDPQITPPPTVVGALTFSPIKASNVEETQVEGPIPTVFTVGTQTFKADSHGFSVAGTYISYGGPGVTISGQKISLGSAGLIVGSKTIPVPQEEIFTVGGETLTASGSYVRFGDHTISAGGHAATIDGTAISLGLSMNLIYSSRTKRIGGLITVASNQVFAIGSEVLTASSETSGIVVLGDHTLSPSGSAVTIDGTLVSLYSAGYLVYGSRTEKLGGPVMTAPKEVFTVGSEIFNASSGPLGEALLGGHTFAPSGSVVIVDGTAMSLDSTGELVIGSSTIEGIAGATTVLPDLGNEIMSAFGARPMSTSNPGGKAVENGTSSVLAAGNATTGMVAFERSASINI